MERTPGFLALAHDAVEATTNLVERTHRGVVERSVRRVGVIKALQGPCQAVASVEQTIAGGIFRTIRGINRAVRVGTEPGTGRLVAATKLRSATIDAPYHALDVMEGVVNGFFGDTLRRNGSALDLGMTIRQGGRTVPLTPTALADAFPRPGPKVCIFLHGLSATEWLWGLRPEDSEGEPDVPFGERLESDLGYTPVYLRYNSGRRVAENGRALSALLDELLQAYPVQIDHIVLVGHSMGGLVARSAAHYGTEHGAVWPSRLRHVACIGSPHLGSPVAKAAELVSSALGRVDAAAAEVLTELLDARSEGIQNLEDGTLLDEKNVAGVRTAHGARYSYIASTFTPDPKHVLGHLMGDLLVRVPSATGNAVEHHRRVPFHDGSVFHGLNHFDLIRHPEVYQALRDQIAEAPPASDARAE